MAEIKRNFRKGRQNRDFDDRLVPEGETRSVMNGRVARSEGANVGALENIRGNLALSNFVDDAAVIIGSIRQQSENRIFYFVTGSREDGIYEFNEETETIRIVLRSTTQSGVLKFSVDNLITGIDIIGEEDETLLFWTDNSNTPRRINIERMISRHRGLLDGVIRDPATGEITLTGFTEEEISVVKRPPNSPPILDIIEVDDLNPDNDDELETLREENLKDKFVRFATRWKFIDDEYSVLSPYSEIPFSAGRFSFDRATGELTCMENLVRSLNISFNTGPRDVVEIDLIYKSDDNPIPFIVESYNKEAEGWRDDVELSTLNRDTSGNPIEQPVNFSSNKLYRALSREEADATFHNVPLKAQGQTISANRVVYANYTDRYNIEDLLKTYELNADNERVQVGETTAPITLDINVDLANNALNSLVTDNDPDAIGTFGEKNLKADRDYELGIVYFDAEGRSTPVLTSKNNSIHVPVQRANRRNRLQVTINNKAPHWATHYRFFVKSNRDIHYNIIPLDIITQPDDNEWRWIRISQPDSAKLKEGDFLLLKINDHCFSYLDGKERQVFRVEEIGPRERNFLELEEPRVGRLVNDDTGEELDAGAMITLQKPGIWARLRNRSILGRDVEAVADSSQTQARSNNARDVGNRPIVGDIANYQDVTYYYPGSLLENPDISEDSVVFSGTYTPGTGLHTNAPAGFDDTGLYFGPTLSDSASYPGPMRVKVTIQQDRRYIVEYYTSESTDNPQVRRQLVTLDQGIDLPANGTTVQLFNGVAIQFTEEPEDYNIGDSFTCTWRLADNFMWRCWDKSGGAKGNRYRGPNDTSRYAFNARRAHIMMGIGQIEDGINGGSLVQFGVEDGLNRRNEGNPIALPFEKNEFFTDDVFYDNLEEWIFESGLYSGGSGTTFRGTDRNGDAFGIHQMGFWRGLPVPPGNKFSLDDALRAIGAPAAYYGTTAVFAIGAGLALSTGSAALVTTLAALAGPVAIGVAAVALVVSIFAKGKNLSKDWRLGSGPRAQLIPAGDDLPPLPLYMFIQSGVRNSGRNNKKADPRMRSQLAFVQGTGASEDELTTVPMVFETIPAETATNEILFYEIGQTYKCENGVHYGDDPNNHQLINTVPPAEAGTETSEVIKPVQITLDYSNTIAFSNGVESSVIRDEFAAPFIAQGAKASLTLDEFEQEENIANLIYSGVFNSATGVNNTNVFSSADVGNRSIIKELDTNFGSIQKLYAENRYIYVFQEDKVSRVQVGQQTLTNADGSVNVAASRQFLGEEEPITGEFGISRNPESFAVYGPTKFFSDRNRGVILELTGKELTEASAFGMRDFFRDNLARFEQVIGSYDDYHDQYIVTMSDKFLNPALRAQNIPLLLSRQGFLSRNDACRYPENKLQFTDVYEFYTEDEPQGFQLGDIIYYDVNRTSIFNGDDDWFVWFDDRQDIPVTAAADVVDNQVRLLYTITDPLFELAGRGIQDELAVGQVVTIQSRSNPNTTYSATVTQTDSESAYIRYDAVNPAFETGDDLANVALDLEVRQKFVINIDSFGVVRRKLNCVGIQPLNHDAFRASLQGYQSPQEACGNGIVGRILYHNGDDATPDVGDYIYDSPYAGDEYVEVYQNYLIDFPYNTFDRVVFGDVTYEAIQEVPAGITPADADYWTATDIPVQYKKGRTQRSGWFQIFDGADFEDYVIFIVNGIVVNKIRCAAIRANRTRVLIGDQVAPISTFALSRDEYSARVCRQLPTEERFHDGLTALPVIGDTVFQNDFTETVIAAGSYSLPGGSYMEVNSVGTVSAIYRCIIRECIRDLINTYSDNSAIDNNEIFTDQINGQGVFTFVGIVDEAIYGNTDRQLAANATIRWVARGAERYPSNPNDFYETTFYEGAGADGSLAAGTDVTLTNPAFVEASAGETDLEYTILEFCYDRNLVPQNIINRYYAIPSNVLPAGSYPTASAATALARIFDLTGNIGTGTVEVTEEIFYDRTSTTNRVYYTDENLTPLDGTNGGSDPLWWAFGDADNTAATEACLIDANGVVLECRDRAHPFEFQLAYHATGELNACIATTTNLFLADAGDPDVINRDFEDVTSLRTADGNIPPSGYYSHLEMEGTGTTDDDQRIVRYWDANTETFEARWLSNTPATVENCPISLPGVRIRYSTNEQTAVCSSGTFVTAYLSDSTATFEAKTGVNIWRGEYGTNAFEDGWFGPDANGRTWQWIRSTGTIQQEHQACIQVCNDPDATNTGSNGDCTYPNFCADPNANNYDSRAGTGNFGNTGTCTYDQYTAMLTLTGSITGPAAGYTATGLVTDTRNNGEDWSLGWTVELNDGYEWVTQPSNFSATGTFSGDDVSRTHDITGEVRAVAVVITGCTNSAADNYNESATNDDGSCYISTTVRTGSSATTACDGATAGTGTETTLYYAPGSNDRYTDTALTAGFTGWTSDGTNYRQYSAGSPASSAACPAPSRITGVFINRPTDMQEFAVGEEFFISGGAVTAGEDFSTPFTISIDGGNAIVNVDDFQTLDGEFAEAIQVHALATAGSSATISVTISNGDQSRTGNVTIRISDSFFEGERGGPSQ